METPKKQNLEWIGPDQVMKLHKFKLKKKALDARFNGTSVVEKKSLNSSAVISRELSKTNSENTKKRKNPFSRREKNKTPKLDSPTLEIENTSDTTFELLSLSEPYNFKVKNDSKTDAAIEAALKEVHSESVPEPYIEQPKGKKNFPIDWALKTKLRLMSMKPFSWKGKLKASEEASGTTGYVRCLDIGEQETTLDTSPNARFHQCCLIWQHPYIPWMELFPRSQSKLNLANNNFPPMNQSMKDSLYKDWCSSFRSLFHLLRVRQCPYFYLCGNNFTVLFRSAGICGISEIQAILTPTTRGLRESLNNEEIQFTMPLKPKSKDNCDLENYDENVEHSSAWLKSSGMDESEIRKISFSQSKIKNSMESELDSSHESLVFVTGVEVQALFNFLINCKSLMTATGPYAGVPPTLLSPISFHGSRLQPLKVRESTVIDGKDKYHSLEITGPILPDILVSLCSLLTSDQIEKFSVSCNQLTNTNAFSMAKHGTETVDDNKKEKLPQSVFGLENLTDCGFNKKILSHFCNPNPEEIQNFKSLTFDNNLYTWS